MKVLFTFPFCLVLSMNLLVGQEASIMTVNGKIEASVIGTSLIHEHILVDFIGADETGPHRWDHDTVIPIVLPYLLEIKELGVQTLVECTPAYIGRDPLLLKKLSEMSGIRILTNTGYYGAVNNKFLPQHALEESAEELSDRWIKEAREGIDNTGIQPGFIKIGVNDTALSALHQKIVIAAAKTHLRTGLTIASHTGPSLPAFEQIALLEKEGVSPTAFIWVHAQSEKNPEKHVQAAKKGAWVSLDGLNTDNMESYLDMLENMKKNNLLNKTLLSHDAGWYSPGEKDGGDFRGFTTLFKEFIPLLKANGFQDGEIKQLLETNPAKAFQIKIKPH